MKKIILAIIATGLMATNVYAQDKECLINKDYFEICKNEQVFDAARMQESHLSGQVLELLKDEKMAVVRWPVMGGTTTEITDYVDKTMHIDQLISRGGPKCLVNVEEIVICKNDSVFDKRRMMESHLNGTVLELFIMDDVKIAVVSWPVIGGTTTEVTGYTEEEVKIDDLY